MAFIPLLYFMTNRNRPRTRLSSFVDKYEIYDKNTSELRDRLHLYFDRVLITSIETNYIVEILCMTKEKYAVRFSLSKFELEREDCDVKYIANLLIEKMREHIWQEK